LAGSGPSFVTLVTRVAAEGALALSLCLLVASRPVGADLGGSFALCVDEALCLEVARLDDVLQAELTLICNVLVDL